MDKITNIKKGVDELRSKLLIKEPSHFSVKDFFRAFFGALLFGITFALKGLIIDVSKALNQTHVIALILFTLAILTAEIYFIGYRRVLKKKNRKFGQFWIKRIVAFYSAALLVSIFLVYVYGLNLLPGIHSDPVLIWRIIIALSLPCALGAATSDLLKQY